MESARTLVHVPACVRTSGRESRGTCATVRSREVEADVRADVVATGTLIIVCRTIIME